MKRKSENAVFGLQFGGVEWDISWDFLKTSCRTINGGAFAMASGWTLGVDTTRHITCAIIVVTC